MKPEDIQYATVAKPDSALQVFVSNVEELYTAVDEPANAGKTIVLNEGTYVLTRKGLDNLDRKNQGRLELQQDMSLIGIDETLSVPPRIEADPIDPPNFDASPRYGMIRAGWGNNDIGWLVISSHPDAAAGISTDLVGSQRTRVRIIKVHSGDQNPTVHPPSRQYRSRGVDIRNTGQAVIERWLDVEIHHCEFYGGAQGIRIANFQGAERCHVDVKMFFNKCWNNQIGCLVTNHTSKSAVIEVGSYGDQFVKNGAGCAVVGVLVPQNAITSATSNIIVFRAQRMTSSENNGPVGIHAGASWCAVLIPTSHTSLSPTTSK